MRLEARGLTKRYPGVVALNQVDFEVSTGEVVALIGENGAGKSTLIRCMAGLNQADAGEVRVDGRAVRLHTASEATRLGIAVIHQELNVCDNLDVAGAIVLGREPRTAGFLVDRRQARRVAEAALARLGANLHADQPVAELSVAQLQLVEIAKALSQDARIIVMDEPTSSLTLGETEQLLSLVEELRRGGVGIVYVSHRLAEVQRVADRVVALRDGQNAGELAREAIDTRTMVRMMVGRDLSASTGSSLTPGGPVVEVRDLRTQRYPAHAIRFAARAGEVLGFAGLVGAGRSEVMRAVFGVDRPVSGEVHVQGRPLRPGSPSAAIAEGVVLAPEDRRREGLVTAFSVRENVTLPLLRRYARWGLPRIEEERRIALEYGLRLAIKTPSVESVVSGLSGGNQQKVVLAKWLSACPICLILDEPTRGIDVGAKAEIHNLIRQLAAQGAAIVMVSSDMDEVLALSTRIVVMHEGRQVGEMPASEATEERIMHLAVGHA